MRVRTNLLAALAAAATVLTGVPGAATAAAPGALPAADTTPPVVTSFTPWTRVTNGTTQSFELVFSEAVTGLAAGDIARVGTATGCVVGAPWGFGAVWSLDVTGCSAGTVRLTLRANSVKDVAGNAGPAVAVPAPGVTIDRTAPTVTPPAVSLRTGATVTGGNIPVTLAWTGSDTGGAGIARYEYAQSADGGVTWDLTRPATAATLATTLNGYGDTRVRVRAIDKAGNAGPWATGASSVSLWEQVWFDYTGWWTFVNYANFSGGCGKYSTRAGSWTSFSFHGREVAIVSTKATSRGSVKVYLDGVYQGTVSFYASTTAFRQQAWSHRWSSSGTHTIKLVVVGTAGHPRFDADAISVVD